jgi:hypothetical protein
LQRHLVLTREGATEAILSLRMVKAAVVFGIVGLGLVGAGCSGSPSEAAGDAVKAAGGSQDQSPKLNLSHIECTDDGRVLAHFVLLFAGKNTPGELSGTWNGGTFGPVPSYKSSGNVWHYEVFLPAGFIDILSATVTTAGGVVVTLHNPSAYAGDYQCKDVPVCDVVVQPQDLLCLSSPLGNPGSECGYLGLVPSGKDDNLSGLTFGASMDAYVAIVKSGSGGCSPGESAYRIYVNVHEGDVLYTPAYQDISHVTYCDCAVTPK